MIYNIRKKLKNEKSKVPKIKKKNVREKKTNGGKNKKMFYKSYKNN